MGGELEVRRVAALENLSNRDDQIGLGKTLKTISKSQLKGLYNSLN